MNRDSLYVDQEVAVFNPIWSTWSQGWVIKVARRYVTITTNRDRGGHAREYDIETQRVRGNPARSTSSDPYFRTLAQYDDIKREKEVRAGLKELGISASYGGPTSKSVLSVPEMEAIVELIRRMRGAEGTSLPGQGV